MLDSIFGANPDIKRMQSRCARVLFSAGIGANLATILAALDRHQTARPRAGSARDNGARP